jgi:glycosyltransferase involved in cell wall biosynthesis
MEELLARQNPESNAEGRSVATTLIELRVPISVAICATVELENTLRLADQFLNVNDSLINVREVIIATPNRELARRLQGRDNRLVVVLEQKRQGKVSALNQIIRKATGDILVIASADIKMTSNALPLLVKALIYHEDWGLADSRVQMANGDSLLMDKINKFLWAIHNATLDDLDLRLDGALWTQFQMLPTMTRIWRLRSEERVTRSRGFEEP